MKDKKNYRFLNSSKSTPPPFFDKLTAAVNKSWDSLGSVGCKISELSNGSFEVLFFPALREIYGGKADGEVVFPGFNFNIGRFVRAFDVSPAPKVTFDSLRSQLIPHLCFKGCIDKVVLRVNILESPPGGMEACERVYCTGPKKGQIEVIKKK